MLHDPLAVIDVPARPQHGGLIRYKERGPTHRIIVHDSHTQPDAETVGDVIQALKWGAHDKGLLEIGYHYVIERSGKLVETREVRRIGTHTPGHNLDSVGICLIGGEGAAGPEDNFTPAQREALMHLLDWLCEQYDLAVTDIYGHTEVQKYRFRTHRCPALDMHDLRTDLYMIRGRR